MKNFKKISQFSSMSELESHIKDSEGTEDLRAIALELLEQVSLFETQLVIANRALGKVRTLVGNRTAGEDVAALRKPTINEFGEVVR